MQWSENPEDRAGDGDEARQRHAGHGRRRHDGQTAVAEGAEFDTLWLQSMISHHQGAIEMAKAEVANGANVDIKRMAQTMIDTQQAEIGQMKEMLGGLPDENECERDCAHGYSPQKENYAKRLRRIEGQVRGIAKMIDEDKYCIDVLTQISAVNSALQSVALGLLDEHLGHCVTQAVAEGGDEADAKLAEASAAIARLVRS